MSITDKEHHAGSGLDKPDPKTLTEKLKDGLAAVLPNRADPPAEPELPDTWKTDSA